PIFAYVSGPGIRTHGARQIDRFLPPSPGEGPMPQIMSCPDAQTFKDLAAHQLPPERREEVLAHLEGCSACVRTVESLSLPATDTLAEAMRQSATQGDGSQEAKIQELIKRVSRPTDYSAVLTGPLETSQGPALADTEVCQCLAPARGPGEIGWLGA